MKKFWAKLKMLMKKHFILTIGIAMFLVDIISNLLIVLYDIEYDDSVLGGILLLGKAVYAFPFWLSSEILMPLYLSESLHIILSYSVGILGLVALDLLVFKIVQWKQKKLTGGSHRINEVDGKNDN